MNRYGFYKEFIKGCNLRLKELFNELHSAYQVRNDLYGKRPWLSIFTIVAIIIILVLLALYSKNIITN